MDSFGKIFNDILYFFDENKGTWFSGLGTILLGLFFIHFIKKPTINLWIRIQNWNTIISKRPNDFSKEFNDKHFQEQLKSFINYLKIKIFALNEDANWNSQYFTPLDAEVEVRRGGSKKKMVTDLLSSIKADKKSSAFLVIGDPGSGKSVALRKLCEELLGMVSKTNLIPIYINLKEWLLCSKWTKDNPPNSKELQCFILSQLKGNNDLTDSFLDAYFNKLLFNGHFFIILDSFDEIPMILDENENSWLIDKLSEIIFETLNFAKGSKGILASRFFRKPTSKFNANTSFIIRPFSSTKIQKTLQKSVNFKDELLDELFNTRTELIPVVRNPFAASLLSNYVQNNERLPPNQAALYENYLLNKLNTFEKYNSETHITKEDILNHAKELAYYMFQSEELGLEIPLQNAKGKFGQKSLDVIDILNYTRIGRVGKGFSKNFSFIHRRFNEYFVALKLLENNELVPIDSIPRDSRWRDALVLYCELAPEKEALKIARFCFDNSSILEYNYNRTQKTEGLNHLGQMHCLRFLADSFKSRKNCLSIDDLNSINLMIIGKYRSNKNLLEYKLAAETIGLLHDDELQLRVIDALKHESSWIKDTAIDSCRHVPELNNYLKATIIATLNRLKDINFIMRFTGLMFSFKLSNSFQDVSTYCQFKLSSIIISIIGVIFAFFYNPVIVLFFLLVELALPKLQGDFTYMFGNEFGTGDEDRDKDALRYLIFFDVFSKKCILRLLLILLLPIATAIEWLNYTGIFNVSSYYLLSTIALFLIVPCFENIIFFVRKGIIQPRKVKLETIEKIEFETNVTIVETVTPVNFSVFKAIIEEITNSYKKDSKEFFKKTLTICLYIVAIALGLFIISLVSRKTLILIAVAVIFLSLIYSLSNFLRKYLYDLAILKKLKRMNKSAPWHRDVIEDYYYQFKTSKVRYLFVQLLYNENIGVSGKWKTDYEIPYVNGFSNDDANILLAQLEEKWLGLSK